jgi:glycosyltransferase involved in cell wall biosynthesis
VYELNIFLHLPFVLYLGWRAKGIYVHSIHNSFRALPLYLYRNVITDMHGVFPEELHYYGKSLGASFYRQVERIVVFTSRAIVAVTGAMARHYQEKYGDSFRIFIIPIFDEILVKRGPDNPVSGKLTVIYAGGAQKWQNIEAMMSAMRKTRYRFEFVILTADIPVFEQIVAEFGLQDKVNLRTVPKNQVYEYYVHADLGFILRDDDIVNQAACPTKLVEYLQCGVIPIVLQPNIGDFAENGYSYLTVAQFISESIPSRDELEAMRNNNYRVMERIRNSAYASMNALMADFAV